MSLTENGVSQLFTRGPTEGFAPILQAINVKKVGQAENHRIRTVLSDGKHYAQGILATQLHHLFENEQLCNNSVVCVEKFLLNNTQGKSIIIILQVKVLRQESMRIGEPKVYTPEGAGPPATSAAPAPAPPMYGENKYKASAGTRPPSASAYKGGPYSRSNLADNSAVSSAPIVHRGTSALANGTPITPIASLNMYQNRWTIKARVVTKSDIRTWSNNRGDGSLFSVELLDNSGTDIRATFFKEAVDKYFNFIQEGKVYTVSGGRLKVANAQYNTCKSGMEMTLDQNSEIHLVDGDDGIGVQTYDITKIAEIENIEPGKYVDVMGVVLSVGEVQSLTSKKTGQELKKCDVTIVDDSGAQIRLTIWGKQAETARQEIAVHRVLAARRARISDFNGKSLSGGNALSVDPDQQQSHNLKRWWATQGSQTATSAKSLSGGGSGGGRMDSFDERKDISAIKGESLGTSQEKADYLSFKGHISFLKKDKEGGAWYTACPNKEPPCNNRCKVNQTTDGNWQCDRCHGTFPDCTRRWIFSGTVADDTASTWVSFFDEQAVQLFGGVSADKAFSEMGDQDKYDSLFAMANHTEWVFKCRVKTEVYNDESRVKAQVVRMDPVDYAAESRDMLRALDKYIAA